MTKCQFVTTCDENALNIFYSLRGKLFLANRVIRENYYNNGSIFTILVYLPISLQFHILGYFKTSFWKSESDQFISL